MSSPPTDDDWNHTGPTDRAEADPARMVESRDRLAVVLAIVFWGLSCIWLPLGVLGAAQGHLLFAAYIVVAAVFGIFGAGWWSRRSMSLTYSRGGLAHAGRSSWTLPWADVAHVSHREVGSVAGPQGCLLVSFTTRDRPAALLTAARISRQLRWGLPREHQILVLPMAETDAQAVIAAYQGSSPHT